nr:hypothetical protein [Candidatus Nitrospira neomarina]
MNRTTGDGTRSDALVFFGISGDLAHKKIFPALYAMAKHKTLTVPLIGVAVPHWSLAQLRKHPRESIKQAGKIDDRIALSHLLSHMQYVGAFTMTRRPSSRSSRH